MLGFFCLAESCRDAPRWCVDPKGGVKTGGSCWLREGSSRECLCEPQAMASCSSGCRTCLGSEKLAQTETGAAAL